MDGPGEMPDFLLVLAAIAGVGRWRLRAILAKPVSHRPVNGARALRIARPLIRNDQVVRAGSGGSHARGGDAFALPVLGFRKVAFAVVNMQIDPGFGGVRSRPKPVFVALK